jgi:hypothetical protein
MTDSESPFCRIFVGSLIEVLRSKKPSQRRMQRPDLIVIRDLVLKASQGGLSTELASWALHAPWA